MSSSLSPLNDSSTIPTVHISYECVVWERLRESSTSLYEIACSILYDAASSHLSLRVTGQNTYRNAAAKDISFTIHAAGATAYIELLEAERLEIRIVEKDGSYNKAFYLAQKRELVEMHSRRIISTIESIKE